MNLQVLRAFLVLDRFLLQRPDQLPVCDANILQVARLHFAHELAVGQLFGLRRSEDLAEKPDGQNNPQKVTNGELPLLLAEALGHCQLP